MSSLASPCPRFRHLIWLPALVLIAWGILSAAGVPLTESSKAADVTVNATVAKEVHIALDDAGLCGPITGSTSVKSITGASMTISDSDVTLATCRLTFGSNNSALGAQLLIESTRTAGSNSFCSDAAGGGACAGTTFTDVNTAGVNAATFTTGEAASSGNFGVKAATNGGTCAGAMVASGNYYGLPQDTDAGAGSSVCSTASTTDGDVNVEYHANPGSTQPAGAYIVQTTLTATAN